MGKHERERKERRKQWLILTLVVVALVIVAYGVSELLNPNPTVALTFTRPDGTRTSSFEIEVARTPQEQEKGLMYRKTLDPDGGMIFVYQREQPQTYWMHNTYVSLDMIFLDSKRTVVGILPRVPILNDLPRKIDKPSQYVIELAAGAAERERIVVGSRGEWH